MASITTAVPVGTVDQWCILPKWNPWFVEDCATNFASSTATAGPPSSDFFNICCDGNIISKKLSLPFEAVFANASNTTDPTKWELQLDDLVCCNARGSKRGSYFGPLGNISSGIGTTCTAGTPTPLASMAALNTDNAALYLYTLTAQTQPPQVSCDPAAVFGCDDLFGGTDSVWTGTPYCLWMNTARAHNVLSTITVPAAHITTAATPSLLGWGSSQQTSSSSLTASSSEPSITVLSGTVTAPPSAPPVTTTAPLTTASTPSSACVTSPLPRPVLLLLGVAVAVLGGIMNVR